MPDIRKSKDKLNKRLDSDFKKSGSKVVRDMKNTNHAQLDKSRDNLIDAINKSRRDGTRLDINDPAIKKYQAELERLTKRQIGLLDASGERIVLDSISTAKDFFGEFILGDPRVFSFIDVETINNAINYINKPEWNSLLKRLGNNQLDRSSNIIINGLIQELSPRQIARQLVNASNMIYNDALTLTRTLQLTSYRDTYAIYQLENQDFITKQIRIASLDARCCLACIALHGTEIPVGSRIDDHYNGRCIGVSVTVGYNKSIKSGSEWFATLPANKQKEIMGIGNYTAYKEGKVSLEDYVKEVNDPIFGKQIIQDSLYNAKRKK